ncbi:endonuclease/exonuclease/phosphatase family protein [Roseinatronobacter alkalisoli]|uniref:Endonuclease/exonuclease/phosphatase family protein n=1 Tax=Roseinatronobacter alkalisoli TaxID=3028235 RepID=A0ABT5T9Y0_9RHOB|nr:endonuclease/exonuclease/phosphatase family protein [Roseinatronobacter sp. HJB301]MDD7971925.1 endonuclease/exonuclease/phosphatase family protein [Roseinatronobacter sp. HJB301]
MRDILENAPAPVAKAQLIAHVAPDVLVLSGLDHDHDGVALAAFRDLIASYGHVMAHVFAFPSNAGLRTGLDMTGDGRAWGPDDTQGYGDFAGQKALAILSRFPILPEKSRDFSEFLWRDLPESLSPYAPGGSMPDPVRHGLQRLSSTGHWDVALDLPDRRHLHLLVYQAGPPVFGGRSNRNLHRNHDETAFWRHFLDGALPMPPPDAPFVLMGGSNLDPFDGDGLHDAMRGLLAHPAVQDPQPASDGARHAAQAGASSAHQGPHVHDTVDWPQVPGPGNLRVSYILPARSLKVTGAGVLWPLPGTPESTLLGDPDDPPTRHRLVWVDIDANGIWRAAENASERPFSSTEPAPVATAFPQLDEGA